MSQEKVQKTIQDSVKKAVYKIAFKYKTKNWKLDGFEYDPYGYKPDWWLKKIEIGEAMECHPRKETDVAYATFKDKRSQHKAFVGDWIIIDEFGRIDVYSARNYAARFGTL